MKYNWNNPIPHKTVLSKSDYACGSIILLMSYFLLLLLIGQNVTEYASEVATNTLSIIGWLVGISFIFVYRMGVIGNHTIRAIFKLSEEKKLYLAFQQEYYQNKALGVIFPFDFLNLIVTTYDKGFDQTLHAYKGTFFALKQLPSNIPINLYCPVGPGLKGDSEFEAIKRASEEVGIGEHIRLIPSKQKGFGKRHAIVNQARYQAIEDLKAAELYNKKGVYAMVDGDSIINYDALMQCCWALGNDPELGGVSTDNTGFVETNSPMFLSWIIVRFLQRFIYQTSQNTVLTGRLSVIRSEIVHSNDFEVYVTAHKVKTPWWLKFAINTDTYERLSGDDKSTLYVVLKQGYKTKFLPFANILCMEDSPSDWFIVAMSILSKRYTTNSLAYSIPIYEEAKGQKMLKFALIDQWLSVVTAFAGPVSVTYWYFTYGDQIIWSYLLWLLSKAVVVTLIWSMIKWYYLGRFDWNPYMPLAYMISEKVLAVIKVLTLPTLGVSIWTRQKISQGSVSKTFQYSITIAVSLLISLIMLLFVV